MAQGSSRAGDNRSRRIAADFADEARLGMLLERTYAGREARVVLPEDALAKMDATLERIAPPPRGRTDHLRTFGVRALAALLLLLLSSVGLSELATSVRNATHSPVATIDGGAGSARSAMTPVAAAASERATGIAPTGQDDAAGSGECRVDRGTNNGQHGATCAPTVRTLATDATPLRDLLARAGIHASDAPAGSGIGTRTPLP